MSTDSTGRLWISLGALNGFLSVALGAFAAHGLKHRLDTYALGVFDKAVDYQMAHALALLAVGLLTVKVPRNRLLNWAGWSFTAGILLISGSLYVLALSGIRALGMITPLGGIGFLLGWGLLAWAAWRMAEPD